MRDFSRASTPTLVVVAAARVGVGLAMIAAPGRFFAPRSGTETLLMRTIGIRDVAIGSGACAALAGTGEKQFRRWAAIGLFSDSADIVAGLTSTSQVGAKSAAIATLASIPFVAAGIFGLFFGARTCARDRDR